MKIYRQLRPDEIIQVGDEYSANINPPNLGYIKVREGSSDIGKRADCFSYIRFRRKEKYVLLKRKYRFLKPHEKIQYGDYPFGGGRPDLDRDFCALSYAFVEDTDSNWYGKTPAELNNEVFVRFVDCVPIK